MTETNAQPAGSERAHPQDPRARMVRRLQTASAIEATTLLLLVLVAVPLKHLFGMPAAVRVVGPVHGLAFLYYAWSVIEAVSGGGWQPAEAMRLAAVAFIPFAGFLNLRSLGRKAAGFASATIVR